MFDRVDIQRIDGAFNYPRAACRDGRARTGDPVDVQIVEDDGVAGLQHRDRDVGSEALIVDRTLVSDVSTFGTD